MDPITPSSSLTSPQIRRDLLRQLAQRVQAIAPGSVPGSTPGSIPGYTPGDTPGHTAGAADFNPLSSLLSTTPPFSPSTFLTRGAIHEWFGLVEHASTQEEVSPQGLAASSRARTTWTPPLLLLTHLAHQALVQATDPNPLVLWIGQRCWPHPPALIHDAGCNTRLLACSVFVQIPPTTETGGLTPCLAAVRSPRRTAPGAADPLNLWAIDLALRCPVVTLVVADGSGLDFTATRRLQLAAEAGGTMALLVRPPHERTRLSAAATRWLVHRLPPPTAAARGAQPPQVRWLIQLLRCKGLRFSTQDLKLAVERTGRGLLRLTIEPDPAPPTAPPPQDSADDPRAVPLFAGLGD